jgi:serine/threonine protein phosphatase PrpC
MIINVATHSQCGKRNDVCQDVVMTDTRDGAHIVVVCDGHGTDGHDIAGMCAAKLVNTLPVEGVDAAALAAAYREVDDSLHDSPAVYKSGSTVVSAIVSPDGDVWIAHAGDCRAVLVPPRGDVLVLTEDHKASLESEIDRMKEIAAAEKEDFVPVIFVQGCARVMGILAISRAFGDLNLSPYVTAKPDVVHVSAPSPGSVMILATDGLWDVVSSEEVAAHVRRVIKRVGLQQDLNIETSSLLKIVVVTLTKMAIFRGSDDDVTIAAVGFGDRAAFFSESCDQCVMFVPPVEEQDDAPLLSSGGSDDAHGGKTGTDALDDVQGDSEPVEKFLQRPPRTASVLIHGPDEI